MSASQCYAVRTAHCLFCLWTEQLQGSGFRILQPLSDIYFISVLMSKIQIFSLMALLHLLSIIPIYKMHCCCLECRLLVSQMELLGGLHLARYRHFLHKKNLVMKRLTAHEVKESWCLFLTQIGLLFPS